MSLVRISTEGAVALITLDRPPVNALNSELVADLGAAIDDAADPNVRAVVITGSPHFAVGADIKEFGAVLDSGGEDALAADLGRVVAELENLGKPTIAAVTGFALGGGLELAMGADFRYLAEDSQVGQPEIKLGLIPGAGGTQRLARLVGWQQAKELVLTGRNVSAPEALALGLADKVLPADQVLVTATADAATWAAGPTRAFAAAKRALLAGYDLDRGLALEVDEFRALFGTSDAREGVAAFIGKRDADFSGT